MAEITSTSFSERFPGLAAQAGEHGLARLIEAFELRDAQAGEALVAEGTESSDLFLVWDGRLDITMAGGGGERRLASVGPGSYFGEVSLLDPGPAGASVVTEQGCAALCLSRARFDELRSSDPATAGALLGDVLASLSARARAAGAGLAGVAEGAG